MLTTSRYVRSPAQRSGPREARGHLTIASCRSSTVVTGRSQTNPRHGYAVEQAAEGGAILQQRDLAATFGCEGHDQPGEALRRAARCRGSAAAPAAGPADPDSGRTTATCTGPVSWAVMAAQAHPVNRGLRRARGSRAARAASAARRWRSDAAQGAEGEEGVRCGRPAGAARRRRSGPAVGGPGPARRRRCRRSRRCRR